MSLDWIMVSWVFSAAFWLSILWYSWVSWIARNPEAADKMFTPGIIVAALLEFIALLCFVVIYLGELSS